MVGSRDGGDVYSSVTMCLFLTYLNSELPVVYYTTYVTVYGKTRHMGFFVKIKLDVYLISSTLELTYLQV